MQSPGPHRLIALIAVAIGICWVWLPAPIGAQAPDATGGSPATGEAAAPVIEPIPLDAVSERAETALGELDAFLQNKDSRQAIERIGSELEPILGEIESRLEKTRLALKGEPSADALRSLEAQTREALDQLKPLEAELDTLIDELTAGCTPATCGADRTQTVVKASCSALLSSAPVTIH